MASPAKPTEAKPAKKKSRHHGDGYREMIESIIVAFVLAFLFRTFEAEAFVIPTGSMAPTLMGRHKDVECPQCGYPYRVSASEEIDDEPQADPGWRRQPVQVVHATCPNCRNTIDVRDKPSFKGDRILVLKFPYTFRDPERWDVLVFKFPEQESVNYIKRLVGLPGEQVRIYWGDIYVRPRDGAEQDWRIARKPPAKQQTVQMLVFDNDHQPNKIRASGWPDRWQPEIQGAWSDADEGREFSVQTAGGNWAWLRYHHLVPTLEDWKLAAGGFPVKQPREQLITDYYGYNGGVTSEEEAQGKGPGPMVDRLGVHWVGDLTLCLEVELQQAGGELLCELVEGYRRYQVRFDLTTGNASLWLLREGAAAAEKLAEAATDMRNTGSYELAFANVDDQLTLWVNGNVVPFGGGERYEPASVQERGPSRSDLLPAGIAARDTRLTVRHLQLYRDIYYIGYPAKDYNAPSTASILFDLLSSPSSWEAFRDIRERVFDVPPDSYFVLGDNSPRSKDGRLWSRTNTVDEQLLIGQAFFIYWPHGIPFSFSRELNIPGLRRMQLPFRPQVERMHLIR